MPLIPNHVEEEIERKKQERRDDQALKLRLRVDELENRLVALSERVEELERPDRERMEYERLKEKFDPEK